MDSYSDFVAFECHLVVNFGRIIGWDNTTFTVFVLTFSRKFCVVTSTFSDDF